MAATLVGGALLSASFSVLLDRLSSPELINFFREDKQITNRAVNEWLDELKDAVYHAEDLVDEIATEALRCKVEAGYHIGPNQVQSLISSFTKLFDDKIESKLESMIDILEDFTKEKDVLGLREVVGRNWSQTRLPTTSLVDESCVYGRENDREEIIKLLLSDGESSNKIDVIPIVGMGGVGKTTLAQLLFNDDRLYGHFVKKAWVCVSDVFDVLSVTRTIVEAINGRVLDARDLNSLQELVSIWIAEGFLEKPKNNKTVEEEGYECFRELLSRSFFQRSNANDSLYVMHDLVHDLAQYVMGDFCYRLEDGNPHVIAEKVRYFSFVRSRFCSFEKFKEIREVKCLRTFLPFKRRGDLVKLSKKVVDEILPRLTRLRLLSLSEYGIKELPNSIGDLIHLRFLDLSRTQIKKLPESICTLYNLETLLLFKCGLLTTLPADFVKLISLRHLDLSGTNLKEMPMNISRLKDLQQLTVFVVGKCTSINELGEFPCLRGTISISGLQNVKSSHDALEAKMSEKRHLERLALNWYSTTEDSQNARDVLQKLEPHTNLKHLEIKNYGGTRFPTWLGDQSLCNMASLRLENCENCFSLPPLGQMPSLKDLTIARMPGITSVGYDGEFSRLQKLEVIKCPKLIGHLPTKVPSLVGLEINKCPELVASLSRSTSICKLVLKECHGVQLEWQGVSSLETLCISSFTSLKEFPSELVTLKNLKELRVEKCPRLYEELSEEMSHCYTSLERLDVSNCERLKSMPLGLFPKLRSLEIWFCKKFETLLIPDGIELWNLTLLEKLTIFDCYNMLSFPCGGLPAPNLSSLSLYRCEKLKALPEQMHTFLPSLQSLTLSDCPEIESFPEGGLPSKLGHLYIRDCKKLVGGRRHWGLQMLPSLTTFSLEGQSEDVLESFPEEGLLPSTLTSLYFGDLLNLKSLNERGLQLLGSLKYMIIFKCPQLQSLPEERLPSSLLQLEIRRCPLLKPRCRREEGEDWHKIARIRFIAIDGEVISEERSTPKSLAFDYFQKQAGHASLTFITSTACKCLIDYYELITIFEDGTILVPFAGDALFLYDPKSEHYEDVEICGITLMFHGIAHVSSLFSLRDVAKGENVKLYAIYSMATFSCRLHLPLYAEDSRMKENENSRLESEKVHRKENFIWACLWASTLTTQSLRPRDSVSITGRYLIAHNSPSCYGIFVDEKIRSGALTLQGNVGANPFPGHKGFLLRVVIHLGHANESTVQHSGINLKDMIIVPYQSDTGF
ncbi:hypothetical protein RHSIM_Rhsim04G0043400 [Rhododendron simsii]|uniref:Uncharacterized protein n=1 Tax=Rhododendron simsii TaxID=118357 RepID=A0A834LNJ4_RHOSS|nr:hypothetical protein RHSIM_Rhsim04G0043400 [Rhododendron simsii]